MPDGAADQLRAPLLLFRIVPAAPTVTHIDPPAGQSHPAIFDRSALHELFRRYPVRAVFHGHAHRGRPEGKTALGVPVYNVSLPLLRAAHPDRPFRIFEVEVPVEAAVAGPV